MAVSNRYGTGWRVVLKQTHIVYVWRYSSLVHKSLGIKMSALGAISIIKWVLRLIYSGGCQTDVTVLGCGLAPNKRRG